MLNQSEKLILNEIKCVGNYHRLKQRLKEGCKEREPELFFALNPGIPSNWN
jgi:hypothetical protein